MNRLFRQRGVVLFSLLATLITSVWVLVPRGQRSVALGQKTGALAVAQRIDRVENGLLPPAVLKGETPAKMKLEDRMRFYKTPGVSIAVINDGRVEWARGYGFLEAGGKQPVTPETLFQAASNSKSLTAMVVLRLIEQGKLD